MTYCLNCPTCNTDNNGFLSVGLGLVAASANPAVAIILLLLLLTIIVCNPSITNDLTIALSNLYQKINDGTEYVVNVIAEAIDNAYNSRQYPGFEIHHIVAKKAPMAKWSRKVLKANGFWINHPANLVPVNKTLQWEWGREGCADGGHIRVCG